VSCSHIRSERPLDLINMPLGSNNEGIVIWPDEISEPQNQTRLRQRAATILESWYLSHTRLVYDETSAPIVASVISGMAI
jgi:hypothetical protein